MNASCSPLLSSMWCWFYLQSGNIHLYTLLLLEQQWHHFSTLRCLEPMDPKPHVALWPLKCGFKQRWIRFFFFFFMFKAMKSGSSVCFHAIYAYNIYNSRMHLAHLIFMFFRFKYAVCVILAHLAWLILKNQ